jgi:septal ring factor EnvC (AmiA/AmiB activator)
MKLRYLAYSLVFGGFLCGQAGFAADPPSRESEAKLAQVRERIQRLQIQLRQERVRQDEASAQLRKLDEKVGRIAGRLRLIEQKLADGSERVETLRREVAAQHARVDAHRDQLGRQLRAAYANGNSGYLKLLLNEEDPLRLGRVLAYHRYIQASHERALDTAAAELQRLSELEQALAAETSALEALRERELRAQQEVAAARREKAAGLARIEASIAAKGGELDRLKADADALEQLLDRLRDALADLKDLRLEERPFRASRGRLDWPLSGGVLARFDEARGVGAMRWRGVQIEGRVGDPVRAVARGHIVFADWLRGFGLLLIIDHGDGFMTLYGYNEAIFKESGDWVQAGDVIASVGTGRTRRKPGLYFEVRSGGKPVDPLQWLRPARDG